MNVTLKLITNMKRPQAKRCAKDGEKGAITVAETLIAECNQCFCDSYRTFFAIFSATLGLRTLHVCD